MRAHSAHWGSIRAVVLTADGQRIISAGADQEIRLWDAASGECLRTLQGHFGGVNSLSLGANEEQLLSASGDKTLRLWDLATGSCLRTYGGHTHYVTTACMSADGSWALSGSDDETMRLWDVATGACLRIIEGHGDWIKSVCLSDDERLALSASLDKTMRLWDLSTGRCLRVFEGNKREVISVSMSRDGRLAISCDPVRLWDVQTGRCLSVLEGHEGPAIAVDLSADGTRAVTGGQDGTLRIWDVSTRECLAAMEGDGDLVRSVCLAPDGVKAVSGDYAGGLRLWDAERGILIRRFETKMRRDMAMTEPAISPTPERGDDGDGEMPEEPIIQSRGDFASAGRPGEARKIGFPPPDKARRFEKEIRVDFPPAVEPGFEFEFYVFFFAPGKAAPVTPGMASSDGEIAIETEKEKIEIQIFARSKDFSLEDDFKIAALKTSREKSTVVFSARPRRGFTGEGTIVVELYYLNKLIESLDLAIEVAAGARKGGFLRSTRRFFSRIAERPGMDAGRRPVSSPSPSVDLSERFAEAKEEYAFCEPASRDAGLQDRIMKRFPYPLAVTYSRMIKSESPHEKTLWLPILLDVFLRYHVLSAPSLFPEEIEERLKKKLSLGAWGELFTRLSDAGERTPFPYVAAFQDRVARNILFELIAFRNRVVGHATSAPSERQCAEYYKMKLPALLRIFSILVNGTKPRLCVAREILARKSGWLCRIEELHGTGPAKKRRIRLSVEIDDGELLLIWGRMRAPLSPFIRYMRCDECGTEHIFFANQIESQADGARKIKFVSFGTECEASGMVGPHELPEM